MGSSVDDVESQIQARMAAAAGPLARPSDVDPVETAMQNAATKGPSGDSSDKGSFKPLQAALAYGSGALASIGAGYRGLWDLATGQGAYKAANDVQDTQSRFTVPTNQRTAEVMASPWNPLNAVSGAASDLGQTIASDTGSPLLGAVANAGLNFEAMGMGGKGTAATLKGVGKAASATADAAGAVSDAVRPSPMSAQQIVDRQAQSSPQSMGAAAAAPNLQGASPQLQKAVVQTAQKTGGAVNNVALQNRLEAESHGIQLMDGQASRDPNQFSAEQNSTDPRIVKRINDQDQQIKDAIDEVRGNAAPGTIQNNPIENGQIAVDSLKAYDEPIKADIKSKYQALVNANGGTVPIDSGQFLSNVDGLLKKQYLTNSVPPAATELMNGLRAGEPLDFEGYENARTRLAEAQRGGGSEGVAAGIIRNQLEQLPLSPTASGLKGLADTARSAAKARFDALDADPAYQAAVDDTAKKGQPSPLADKFLDKYALNAPKANLDLMMSKLDPEGQSAVTSHALSSIKNAAVTPNGTVSANGFNSSLQKMSPKLDSLAPGTREALESLGRSITNVKVAPPGNYVNYSKSGVIMNAAQGMGEAALNAKTLGLGTPIIKNVIQNKWVKDTLSPGAGLSRLSDISPK